MPNDTLPAWDETTATKDAEPLPEWDQTSEKNPLLPDRSLGAFGRDMGEMFRDVGDAAKREMGAAGLAASTLVPFTKAWMNKGQLSEAKQEFLGETDESGRTPWTQGKEMLPTAARLPSEMVEGLARSVPQLAATEGLSELIQAPLAVGGPLLRAIAPKMASRIGTAVAGGAVFGATPEGFDPKQAAIGALLPVIGEASGAISQKLAAKLGVTPAQALAMWNKAGGVAGTLGVMGADQAREIMKLPPEKRKDAIIAAVGNLGGIAGLGLMHPVEVPPEAPKAPPVPGSELPIAQGKERAIPQGLLDESRRQLAPIPNTDIQIAGQAAPQAAQAALDVAGDIQRTPPPVPEEKAAVKESLPTEQRVSSEASLPTEQPAAPSAEAPQKTAKEQFDENDAKRKELFQRAKASKDPAEKQSLMQQMAEIQKLQEPLKDKFGGFKPNGNEVTPAIRLKDGRVILSDQHENPAGSSHDQAEEYAKSRKEDITGSVRGFVDKYGNFKTREGAADQTGIPTNEEPGKLHSEDVKDAGNPPAETSVQDQIAQLASMPVADYHVEMAKRNGGGHEAAMQLGKAAKTPEDIQALKDAWQAETAKFKALHASEGAMAAMPHQRRAHDFKEAYEVASKTGAWAEKTEQPKEPNASQVQETAALHGDVRPQQESPGGVPVPEGVGGVQPQAEGGLPQAPQGEVALKPAAAKERWQMTKADYSAMVKKEYGRQGFPDLKAKQATDATHAKEVADAVKSGKPVPPEVLADYPDLKPAAATPEKPAVGPGMGAALYGETTPSPNTPTSIKNATVDQERAKRGLPAAMEPLRRSFQAVWDKAMAHIDTDPTWLDGAKNKSGLIEELRNKPRALTDEEDAALLHRQVDLQNEYGKVTRDIAQAYSDGRTDDLASLQLRRGDLSDQLLDLYNIGKRAGTETARGLNARKMMAMEDFSLAQMELSKRAANDGKPLTDDQRQEVADLHAKIADSQKRLDEFEAKQKDMISRQEANATIDRLKAEHQEDLKGRPDKISSKILKLAQDWVDKADKDADEATKRMNKRFGRMGSSPDPSVLPGIIYDFSMIGQKYLAHATLNIVEFTAKLVEHIKSNKWGPEAEKIAQDNIDEIWNQANKTIEGRAKGRAPAVKRAIDEKAATKEVDARTQKIGDKVRAGKKNEIAFDVQKLAKALIANGVDSRDELIDRVHDILKESIPEITRREAMDAIAGYGVFKQLSKDEVSVTLRGWKGEMQSMAKIEDIIAGKPLQKTGIEQAEPTDEKRRLDKQVEELKRRHGVVVTDPATQLKSALDAIKTRLRNQISDLQYQIDTKEKIVKDRTAPPTDDETAQLRAQRDALKAEFDKIFPKAGITDEQRIKMATAALERQITEYDRLVAEKQVKAVQAKTPTTPELETLRAQRDAARAAYEEMRGLDEAYQNQQQEARLQREKAALEKSIAQKQADVAAGGAKPQPQEVKRPHSDPATEKLLQERDNLNRQLAELRKLSPEERQKAENLRKLARMTKLIQEKEAAIASGKVGTKAGQVNRPLGDPALETAKLRLEELNRQIAEILNPKKSEAERALQAAKTRTLNNIADLHAKIAAGDYKKTPRRVVQPDRKLLELRAENERAKQTFRKGVNRDRLANRTFFEKAGDIISKAVRFGILSGPSVMAKLVAAGIWRITTTPIKEGTGSGIDLAFPQLAGRAARGGGFNLRAEIDAITHTFTTGMRDAWQTLRTGKSDLEAMYGDDPGIPPSVLDLSGRVHAAIKAPVKRNEFARSFRKRMDAAAKQGVDITDELVQASITAEAYEDANRAVFLQKNMANDMYKRALTRADQPSKKTGHKTIGGVLAGTALRSALPVTKVPLNIVGETFEHAIGVGTGSWDLGKAVRAGFEQLQPDEADAIYRKLENGSLGGALILMGYFAPGFFGGFFQKGEKRKKGDIKPGEARVFGQDIKARYLDNPLAMAIQVGATMRRVQDSKLRMRDTEKQGLGSGTMAAAAGLTEATPFVKEMLDVAKFYDAYQRKQFLAELAKSRLEPQLLQQIAAYLDKDKEGNPVQRKQVNTLQTFESGIPILRTNVPIKPNIR